MELKAGIAVVVGGATSVGSGTCRALGERGAVVHNATAISRAPFTQRCRMACTAAARSLISRLGGTARPRWTAGRACMRSVQALMFG